MISFYTANLVFLSLSKFIKGTKCMKQPPLPTWEASFQLHVELKRISKQESEKQDKLSLVLSLCKVNSIQQENESKIRIFNSNVKSVLLAIRIKDLASAS
uniref:DUF6451 domain-containing protein n=1 Tax=Trichobilharzia regenti TaxID=157069 RepID=A0AA85KDH5_TRIRE|nr:unnamed protein product [Trichobilharzia regenti]